MTKTPAIPDDVKNKGNSVKDLLRNEARAKNVSLMEHADRYAYTGILRRLFNSPYKEDVVVRGGLMNLAYFGDSTRSTRDVDLVWDGSLSLEELSDAIKNIVSIEPEENDGLWFDTETMRVVVDRSQNILGPRDSEKNEHTGWAIQITAYLGKTRIPVNIDVGCSNNANNDNTNYK